MCGIAGFIHFNDQFVADAARLKKMTDCIAYRGPDGEGAHVVNNLALGHRRLSIIDLSTGQQPMSNEVRQHRGEVGIH
ncbi:MAG TPA: asparagine synthetase B, partial [Bacteroidia bacterium]|nr:asparagine synthetase B [Bacteroidia bacterium]